MHAHQQRHHFCQRLSPVASGNMYYTLSLWVLSIHLGIDWLLCCVWHKLSFGIKIKKTKQKNCPYLLSVIFGFMKEIYESQSEFPGLKMVK